MTCEGRILVSGVTGNTGRRRSSEAEAVAAAVAFHVKHLRQGRGWSLEELAQRSAVSKGMIVQIEGGRTNPSIGTLCRLAESFGVNVGRLLEAEPPPSVRIIDADAQPTLWHGDLGGAGRLLVGVNDPAFVEFWDWRMEPGETHSSAEHTPGTRELWHVRSGRLIVSYEGTEYAVEAGQTLDFRSDRPHGYRNPGPEPAETFMVIVMPPGEWDRRRS
ncbi:transcriptional regulator [Virgisporangium aliadipatigenens]|uniref:Transcriptional regulator n=1 Tax=Virgisporangium aliadipatigenens TaxID=741659 RepID=A0A8J3YS82_9ACTN|nr:transcriptional regulator [Virgisporangium aliadipatigenens]